MLYACDGDWWKYRAGVPEFHGMKITADKFVLKHFPDLRLVQCRKGDSRIILQRGMVGWGGNSGFHALNMAVQWGARAVVLLGFDMQAARTKNGTSPHWHGHHAGGLNNPTEMNFRSWRAKLGAVAPFIASLGVEVINATDNSALTCFRRATIDEALSC